MHLNPNMAKRIMALYFCVVCIYCSATVEDTVNEQSWTESMEPLKDQPTIHEKKELITRLHEVPQVTVEKAIQATKRTTSTRMAVGTHEKPSRLHSMPVMIQEKAKEKTESIPQVRLSNKL